MTLAQYIKRTQPGHDQFLARVNDWIDYTCKNDAEFVRVMADIQRNRSTQVFKAIEARMIFDMRSALK